SYELHLAARAYRSFALRQIVGAIFEAIGAAARQAYRRYQKRREAAATYDTLRRPAHRAPRDLGFNPRELASLAAELGGEVEHTRLQEPQKSPCSSCAVEHELA